MSVVAALLFNAGNACATIPYLPYVAASHEVYIPPFYNGTSNPVGIAQINVVGTTPGYFNGVSTVGGSTASGEVLLTSMPQGVMEFVGVAIHVTDTAGPSHSLSSLSDPALADLVFDVNKAGVVGDFPINAYAYNSAPVQYAGVESILSAGEAALGGQPFDLLLTGTNLNQPVGKGLYWSIDISTAISNIDGITAIGVSDIGAVPEPTDLATFMVLAAPALLARRRR